MSLSQRLTHYERLMRLDKPIGILLLLWPTLWGLWIASLGRPHLAVTAVFIIGTVLMRSAGCVINDLADRKFDGQVERTRERPLASGAVSVKEALWLAAGLVLLAFLLVLTLNRLAMLLAVPAFLLAVIYPFTKRFFAVPQAVLGIAFGFGIPMAFAAETGNVPLLAWILLAVNVFWAMAYDTEYAMVDREDDLKLGLRTSAITFGRHEVAFVIICYCVMLAILVWLGIELEYGLYYFGGLLVAAQLAFYHYTLIRGRDRALCFKAFLNNNWLGAAVFGGIVLDHMWRITGL